MAESDFQKKVLEYLNAKGGHWIKIHVSSFQSEGEPDIVGCYKGLFVAFELKNPNGKGIVSKMQVYKINHIVENKGFAIATNDLGEIKFALNWIDDRYEKICAEIQRVQQFNQQ